MSEYENFKMLLDKLTAGDLQSLSGSVSYINNYSILKLLKLETDVIEKIDYIRIDGLFLTFCLWPFLRKRLHRHSFDMTSDAKRLFNFANENHKRIVAVGASESENSDFIEKSKARYPNITWHGINGYISASEMMEEITKLEDVDYVLIGLGTPFQEKLQCNLKGTTDTSFTCGAFISQTSRAKALYYYPRYINMLNLRWLYRVWKEPHVLGRVVFWYPLSLLKIIKFYFLRC